MSSRRRLDIISSYFKSVKWASLLGGISIMLAITYITIDVAGRYLASSPLPATDELTSIFMVFIIFFGLAYAQSQGEHLRLGFILERSSDRRRAALDALCFLIGTILTVLMSWQAVLYTWGAWRTNELMQGVWRLPYFPSRLGLTIGMFLFSIQYAINFAQSLKQAFGPVQTAPTTSTISTIKEA